MVIFALNFLKSNAELLPVGEVDSCYIRAVGGVRALFARYAVAVLYIKIGFRVFVISHDRSIANLKLETDVREDCERGQRLLDLLLRYSSRAFHELNVACDQG